MVLSVVAHAAIKAVSESVVGQDGEQAILPQSVAEEVLAGDGFQRTIAGIFNAAIGLRDNDRHNRNGCGQECDCDRRTLLIHVLPLRSQPLPAFPCRIRWNVSNRFPPR